jgi:beta-1,4-N-acetylglucosaminyltransferase
MLVFVTVGSTKFDALVQAAISEPVLAALRNKRYTQVVLQRGNSDLATDGDGSGQDPLTIRKDGMEVETWKFKPSIQNDIERADLVISHAGEHPSTKSVWIS